MYEPTQLFWYKPIFMTELLLAELIFSFRLKRRAAYPLRMLAGIAVCYGTAAGFPIPFYNAVYCSFMFVSFFFVTVMQLKLCYKEPLKNIVFCAIAGYAAQHIAFEMYELIITASGLNGGSLMGIYSNNDGVYEPFKKPETELIYFFVYIIVYWAMYVLLARKIKKDEPLQLKNAAVLVFVALVVGSAIVLTSIVTYYVYLHYDRFFVLMIDFFNILCCLMTLCFQFELPLRKQLENELTVINRLLSKTKEHYAVSKENIELVNLKCHDLKHQIHTIGHNSAIDTAAIKEIENVISIYDSAVKTGNEALDVILTEKSLLCRKAGITLSCIADGVKLNFMKEPDVYSLFGNAIDNAIEAVGELPDDERVIGVTIRKIETFLSVNIHNYYDKTLEFEEGLPKTTKADARNHGFGMKSIRMICGKYNGDLSVKGDNRIFNLNILFPLSGDAQ